MAAPSDEPRGPETGRLAELAERRSRRAAETGLIDRAERAERTVTALERRLDEAEGRLEVAQRERTTLSASLEQAQRDLTDALQREFAEQRMRLDAESEAGGEFAELEAEITRLGADHAAAEARAAALTRALQDARHDVDTARAQVHLDSQAGSGEQSRSGVPLQLGELQALAEDLRGSLIGERAAREEAELALISERERAEAEITLLQHELDRREMAHDTVRTQIGELRGGLEAVRGRAERDEDLEQAIATLEGEQRRTSARLADTRELLGAREAELIAVEDRLVATEAELDLLRAETEGYAAARRLAEDGVASVHARGAELEGELEEAREARRLAEARLEIERRGFADVERQLRAELESRHAVSDERLAAAERTVDVLRAELAAAASELDERLAAERVARSALERELELERRGRTTEAAARRAESGALARRLEAVESELADTQAAAARERARADRAEAVIEATDLAGAEARAERAEAMRDELAADLAGRAEREQRVGDALSALREELEEAQAEGADRAEREAAVESLVADLVDTAHGLRAGFEQELEALAAARDAERAEDRREFAAELADMERRVGELRDQLTAAAEQLRDELERERSARWVAEAELTREVTERAEAEERTGQALDALTRELERLRAAPEANPVYDPPPAGSLVPRADHPALARATLAPAGAPAVVGDLARALDRLRGSDADRSEEVRRPEDRPHAPEEEPGPDGEASVADEELAVSFASAPPPVPAAPSVPSDTSASPPPTDPEGDVGDPVGSAAAGARLPAGAQPETAWFGPRLADFARTDEPAAERMLLSALAAQAHRAGRPVTYELRLPVSGRHRVEVVPGDVVHVAPVGSEHPQAVDFRLEGPVAALFPLACGEAPRRLAGVKVRGRRRRLRRLLRDLRAPLGLDELQSAGSQPLPADLLALLCGGVPPTTVAGEDLTVAYEVTGPGGETARIVVRARPDGSLEVDAGDGADADASLTVGAGDLLAVLSGSATAPVTGDQDVVDTLHRWFRAVQGR